MPKYFTYLASANQPKNALQRDVLDLLNKWTRRLVDQPNDCIDALQEGIKKINAAHPRCTPLKAYTYGINAKESVSVALGEQFTIGFHIYRVKEETDAIA